MFLLQGWKGYKNKVRYSLWRVLSLAFFRSWQLKLNGWTKSKIIFWFILTNPRNVLWRSGQGQILQSKFECRHNSAKLGNSIIIWRQYCVSSLIGSLRLYSLTQYAVLKSIADEEEWCWWDEICQRRGVVRRVRGML